MNASLPIKFAPHTGTEIVCWAEGRATMDSKLLARWIEDAAQIREQSRLLLARSSAPGRDGSSRIAYATTKESRTVSTRRTMRPQTP
jgi:hypothetical protein